MNKEKALARLILSTGRNKRNFNLVQVFEDIQFLIKDGSTVKQIANQLGISPGMLNKFLKVDKICPEVKELIKSRAIDSVTLVHNLAKFDYEDQINISNGLINEDLTSHDVRVLAPLRKANPVEDIYTLIKKLVDSKDLKISVIKFPKESLHKDILQFIDTLKLIIGDSNFDSIESDNKYFLLKISKKGEKKLREKAKTDKTSLNILINDLLV